VDEAPDRLGQVGLRDATFHLAGRAFRQAPPGTVGLEAEFFVLDRNDPQRIPSPDELRRLLATRSRHTRLPHGSAVTFEPGGQLELSTPPVAGPLAAIALLDADLGVVDAVLDERGLALRGGGIESSRTPRRWVHGCRYDAMAAHFTRCGPPSADAGRVMMTATAALQVNLDAGADPAAMAQRWELTHLLGPVLAATFACSRVLSGQDTGAASARLQAWQQLDPCRTAPVPDMAPQCRPREQWARYALAASVILVPDADGGHAAPDRFSLADWLLDPDLGGRPVTRADLDYHVTTLFPPVRPRGFLELRYLDAPPRSLWPVAAAVTAVLHDDPVAASAAAEACRPVAGRWRQAARDGLADDGLAAASGECLQIARASLTRMSGAEDLLAAIDDFAAASVGRATPVPAS
jgi:glutamate--cysteine ligase